MDPGKLAIVTPTAQAVVPRDYLAGEGGWVAQVSFSAMAKVRAQSVIWVENGMALGIGAAPDYTFTADVLAEGAHTVDAIAVDTNGVELARAQVTFTVTAPSAAGGACQDQLRAMKQAFSPGPDTPGIVDPVTVQMPLNGMPFTYLGTGTPRPSWTMDCKLALSMWRMVDVMKKNGVVAVSDLGLYNYRCADGTLPPCAANNPLSMHGQGLAVDVAALKLADGSTYTVSGDWIIDTLPSDGNTCTVQPASDLRNQLLHALLCELYADRIYTIFLTPNYNAAHHDHWHMDLTPTTQEIAQ